MDVGARVWVSDPADGRVWRPARLHAVDRSAASVSVVFEDAAGQDEAEAAAVCVIPMAFKPKHGDGRKDATTEEREVTNVLLQNAAADADHADLVALPHLHEASILHALRLRYARHAIYTHIGEILLSVNPFEPLPELYAWPQMCEFAPDAAVGNNEPHLFGVARAAYVDVVRNARNQSILISGESGAGKTEATKILMKYFALTCGQGVGGSKPSSPTTKGPPSTTKTSLEARVLQSNPILESFGNARTVRNDNSSRFGKFIELQLDPRRHHALRGARVRTYLLEKIRVIRQAAGERNFHVFYELLAAADASVDSTEDTHSLHQDHSELSVADQNADATDRALFRLAADHRDDWGLRSPLDFALLNQSGCFERRDGVQDAVQFRRTLRGMTRLGLAQSEIRSVLEIIAAVLHMGNVKFAETQRDNVRAAVVVDDVADDPFESFRRSAELLGVAQGPLAAALTRRTLHTAAETLEVALDATRAANTRDALAMECYRLLFDWLVGRVNARLQPVGMSGESAFIGLLDIFGFEDMAVNSFEQLCINYANEALQHQFNESVFDHEQQLYADEGIKWAFVDFPNNAACLALFEKKPVGLFSLVDQECVFPTGSDRALCTKLYLEFDKKQPHFVAATALKRQTHFGIAHYAGTVLYDVADFLVKNKDAFGESAARLLAQSTNPLIQSLAVAAASPGAAAWAMLSGGADDEDDSETWPRPRRASTSSPAPRVAIRRAHSSIAATSVGSQFKLQLGELLTMIRCTAPRYVRCIKPNDRNQSGTFDARRVVEQLRSGGVLEAVRVARAGFPVRLSHDHFLDRYRRVLRAADESNPSKSDDDIVTSLARLMRVLELPGDGEGGVSLGRTRVFFRRVPYELLESLRATTRAKAAVSIQAVARGYSVRYRFELLKRAVVTLQAIARGQRARSCVLAMRQHLKAVELQRMGRGFCARRKFLRLRAASLALQSHCRRRRAARCVQNLRENRAATRLAAWWRCAYAAYTYKRLLSAVLSLQCAVRAYSARRELWTLRQQSRDVAKLRQDNSELKSELAALREQLRAMQSVSRSPEPVAPVLTLEEPQEDDAGDESPSFLYQTPGSASCEDISNNQAEGPCNPVGIDEDKLVDMDEPITPTKGGAPVAPFPPSRTQRARRFSLPDLSLPVANTEDNADVDPTDDQEEEEEDDMAKPRDRRQSLNLWLERQEHAEEEVAQLREELKASALAESPVDEQKAAMRAYVASQIKSTMIKLQAAEPAELSLDLRLDNNDEDTNEDELPTPPLQWRAPASISYTMRPSVGSAVRPSLRRLDLINPNTPVAVPVAALATPSRARPHVVGIKTDRRGPMTGCGPANTGRAAWNFAAASVAKAQSQSAKHSHGLQAYFAGDDSDDESVDGRTHKLPLPSRSASLGMVPRVMASEAGWAASPSRASTSSLLPRWTKETRCSECSCSFGLLVRRHHCRACGRSFCYEHSTRKLRLPQLGYGEPQRVCDACFEVHLLGGFAVGGDGYSLGTGAGSALRRGRSDSLAMPSPRPLCLVARCEDVGSF